MAPKLVYSKVDHERIRMRVTQFLKEHAPQELYKTDTMLQLDLTEEELMQKLADKYTNGSSVAPSAATPSDDRAELRRKLEAFYRRHKPEDVNKVDVALSVNVPEDVLWQKLYLKYGLGPDGEPVAAPSAGTCIGSCIGGEGPSPSTAAVASTNRAIAANVPVAEMDNRAELRLKLEAFYRRHKPEDMNKVDVALSVNMPEDVLWQKLYLKYGLGPDGEPVAATSAGRHCSVS